MIWGSLGAGKTCAVICEPSQMTWSTPRIAVPALLQEDSSRVHQRKQGVEDGWTTDKGEATCERHLAPRRRPGAGFLLETARPLWYSYMCCGHSTKLSLVNVQQKQYTSVAGSQNQSTAGSEQAEGVDHMLEGRLLVAIKLVAARAAAQHVHAAPPRRRHRQALAPHLVAAAGDCL